MRSTIGSIERIPALERKNCGRGEIFVGLVIWQVKDGARIARANCRVVNTDFDTEIVSKFKRQYSISGERLTQNTSKFARKANQTETIRAMSERFVFDIDNNIIKIKNVGETVARLSDFRVNFGNRLVFVIKTKFIGASQHTVRLIALEFTNAEAEIFHCHRVDGTTAPGVIQAASMPA